MSFQPPRPEELEGGPGVSGRTGTQTMMVWTCRRYGGPEALALERRPVPFLKPNELLIRNRATTVSSGDARVRALHLPQGFGLIGRLMLGWSGPRQPVLGTEVSGVVEAVGQSVSLFAPGDHVVAYPDTRMGGHAEYLVIPESGLIAGKPASLSFEEAASLCFGGLTASDYIRKAKLLNGERLLILGATGTVGSAFVQLAKSLGAHVSTPASDHSRELVLGLGADEILDRDRDLFSGDRRWDVIADTVGASSFRGCLPALDAGGRYLAIAGGLSDMLAARKGSKTSICGPAQASVEDLRTLVRLAEAGTYRPLIDSVHAFSEMRAAHARVDSGRKRGSVVVALSVQTDCR